MIPSIAKFSMVRDADRHQHPTPLHIAMAINQRLFERRWMSSRWTGNNIYEILGS